MNNIRESLQSFSDKELIIGQIEFGLAAKVSTDPDIRHDFRVMSKLLGLESITRALSYIPEEFRQDYLDLLIGVKKEDNSNE